MRNKRISQGKTISFSGGREAGRLFLIEVKRETYQRDVPARRSARDVASVVALVCGQSLDCRVRRRVPNRARARVGVFCTLKGNIFFTGHLKPDLISKK